MRHESANLATSNIITHAREKKQWSVVGGQLIKG
jgi:hypothetical protein